MGGKLSCLPCKKMRKRNRKRNRIFPGSPRLETRSSSEILRELQTLGFVQESAKPGGLTFVVEEPKDGESSDEARRKIPRRLPMLTSMRMSKENISYTETISENTLYTSDEKNLMEEIASIHVEKEQTTYTKDDKDMMAEIRRIGALADKGKMAKQHEERRRRVLEMRETKRQRRILTTQEKLQRERERLETQTPDIPPKRPSYEERRQKVLERRQQLLEENTAKPVDVETDDVKQEMKSSDGMPDVST